MTQERALFDAHCHISSEKIPLGRRIELVRQAQESRVEKMVVTATDIASLEGAFALQEEVGRDIIKIAAAMPPHDVISEKDDFFYEVKKALNAKKLDAIGETGFEYFYCPETKEFQKQVLERYIKCSSEFQVPLVIHCRDGFYDLISLLKEYQLSGMVLRGMIHCFTGSMDEARVLLDLGWYLSFSGMVTYPKAKKLQEVAQFVPLEKLLIETDSPYLAPKQKRGQENRPEYLVYTAEFLALLRGETYESIASATYKNASSLFER
jgi:TatD DNase family protein